VRVHHQLARRVRVHAREQDHPPAADAPRDVLDSRGLRAPGFEPLAHEPLLALGLAQMFREGAPSSGSPAMPGARRSCVSACSSIEWTSVRYFVSWSPVLFAVMPPYYPASGSRESQP
jgi:hypothetical protein